MNWLDLFDDNAEADRKFHRELARSEGGHPCEDDAEALHALSLATTPEESGKEHGSPLHFTDYPVSAFNMDRQIQEAYKLGV